jgi:Flp pilus assembly protein protease CpaA
MFDLTYGILFFFLSTTLIISILVVVLFLTNKVKKIEVEETEAQKSIQKLKG